MNLADRLTGRTSYQQYYRRFRQMAYQPAAQVSGLAILTILAIIFFISFAILPTFKTIAGLKREITDAKNVDAKLSQKIHSLNQAESLLSQITPNLNNLNQVLPEEAQLERLAWQLNWLANKNNVSIISGRFAAEETNFIPVDITLKGDYLSIRNFVNDLNRLDRLIEIKELSLTGKGNRSGENYLSAALSMKAFIQSPL